MIKQPDKILTANLGGKKGREWQYRREEKNAVGINLSTSTRLLSHLHGNQRALYFEGSLNELQRKKQL